MQIQKLKSSKLFYNKWPYKIECVHKGASRIIHGGPEHVESWCKSGLSGFGDKNVDKNSLLKFTLKVKPFLGNKELQIRAEGSHLNFYCKDINILNDIESSLRPWIKQISGPTTQEEYDFLMANGHKKILCDQLPKKNYQYRLYFKTKWPKDKRLVFLTWAKKYPDNLEINPSGIKWMDGDRMWAQDPFMYVKDDKMLSMVGLHLSGYVKKVEEFIPRENLMTA
jgi:hypothetical protein